MDPLDWTHQWDDYEMMMYARSDAEEQGIFIQVARRVQRFGAEEWEILYERRLADPAGGPTDATPGTEVWEEQVLRSYLHLHPQMVNDEKTYLEQYLQHAPDA